MKNGKEAVPAMPQIPTDLKQVVVQWSPTTNQLFVTATVRTEDEKMDVIRVLAMAIPAVTQMRPTPIIVPPPGMAT